MPRAQAGLDDPATKAKQASESLERSTRAFAQELASQNLAQQAGNLRSQDPIAQRIEQAAMAMQDVAKQSQALTPEQSEQVAKAADAIGARDPERLDNAIGQMTRELERLEAVRDEATTHVDKMANDWQTAALGAAKQAAETVRDALQNETNAAIAPEQRLEQRDDKLSTQLREQADAARTLYEQPAGSEPSKEATAAHEAARQMDEVADRVYAAEAKFERADKATLTDDQRSLVDRATNAIREQADEQLSDSVRGLEQERATVEKRIEEARRPLSPDASMREAIEWKAAQRGLEASQKQLDALTAARDLAESTRTALEQQGRLAEKAFGDAMQRDFSKTPALNAMWETAKAGREPTSDGFKGARESFWRQVNEARTPEARAVGTMLKAAGYELGEQSNAPMLKERWDKLRPDAVAGIAERDPDVANRLRSLDHQVSAARSTNLEAADRRLSIDHLDPQSRARGLSLEASNLRLLSSRDNSFRGNRFTPDDQPAARAVDAIRQSLHAGMTVEEANRQRFESEQRTQRLRDAEEIAKEMERERARHEQDRRAVDFDGDERD